MLDKLWIFLWIFGVDYVTGAKSNYRLETVAGIPSQVERRKPLVAFLLILPMILLAGYRSFWYADTAAYHDMFLSYPTSFSGFWDYLPTIEKDVGFYGLSAFFKLLVNDVRAYLVVLAAFQGLSLMRLFRKYSDNYMLSVFLFVASTDLYGWMFNGIRQFTAVTITIFGVRWFLEKKYVPAMALILVASLFHQSALLLIPFIFIAQGEVWNVKTVLFMLAAIVAVVFVNEFTDLMDEGLQSTQYGNVVSDYESWEDDGTNPLRVLVYSVPAIFAFFGRKLIIQKGNPLIHFCANMSIISMGFYLISMVTSGIFIGRLPIYFSLYGYILLPWEIKHLFTEDSREIVKLLMIVLYLGFYAYFMLM